MTLTPRWIAVRRKSLHFSVAACATVLALGLSGCYGPMYSQPYGQPYGQQVYPGTMQPGTQYYPGVPGGATLGTPTYGDPGASGSGAGGDAPQYYGSPTSSTQNRVVPDYNDSGTYNPPPGGGSTDASGLGADEDFKPPLTGGEIKESSLTREVKSIAEQQYAYDTSGHRWLQGVVNYDPRDTSWGIVYSIDPSPTDPHNGYLTLINDPRLAALKDGDVVRLEGRVAPERLDFSSRPSYEVTTVTHISR
jgi:hypothetical protein